MQELWKAQNLTDNERTTLVVRSNDMLDALFLFIDNGNKEGRMVHF